MKMTNRFSSQERIIHGTAYVRHWVLASPYRFLMVYYASILIAERGCF